jgi:3-dehydroquinate dehydratase-2
VKTIWVLNGPNLNLLGEREPAIYGRATLSEIERTLVAEGKRRDADVECFQSNHEGALIDRIHLARGRAHGLVVNLGALSHTSIALADAIAAAGLPTVEVHLSNVHAREPFRRRLLTAAACIGTISGLGPIGYRLALEALLERLTAPENAP